MVLSSRQVAMLLNRDKSVVNRWAKRHEVPKIDGFYLWTEAKMNGVFLMVVLRMVDRGLWY